MKKEKFDMSNLGLPTKPEVIKPVMNTQAILQKAVENIHRLEVEESPLPSKTVDAVKKVSMDLPLDLYKAVKIFSFEEGISMKDYIAFLIRKDMESRRNG